MLHRIPLVVLLLFAFGFQAKAAQNAAITPLLNESIFLVVRFDLEKIDFEQINKNFQKNVEESTNLFGAEPMIMEIMKAQMEQQLKMLQGLVESLRKEAKAKELYIYTSTEFFPHQIPCFFAIPLAGEDPEMVKTLNNLFARMNLGVLEFPTRFARHGFYFVVPGQSADNPWSQNMLDAQREGVRQLYRTLRTTDRPEVAQAFAELAGDPVQLILMRVPMFTAAVDMVPWEEVPFLQAGDEDDDEDSDSPDPFGSEKAKPDSLAAKVRYELREGISWTAFGLDPQQERSRWIIKSQGPGGAKRTAETLDALVDQISGWIIEDAKYRYGNPVGQHFESKEELQSLITLFLPKVEPQKELLSLTIDKAFNEAHTPKIEAVAKRIQQKSPFGNVKRMQDANNLKMIGLAMHNHHDSRRMLPSASTADANGKLLHSWRVALLPFIEEQALYNQIKHDEPWDSEHNKQFHNKMPRVYASPFLAEEDVKKGLTSYTTITGHNAPFPGPNGRETFARWSDGTSNQIVYTHRMTPVCWMDPAGDVDFEIAKKGINKDKKGLGSPSGDDGVNVAFGDGAVAFFPDTSDPKVIEALINPRDGQRIKRPYSDGDPRPERPKKLIKPSTTNTVNNLKMLMLGMHNYHDVYKSLPSTYAENKDKKPLHSWRVALLPLVEEPALYEQIRRDEPWDSEYNKQFHDKMPAIFISSGLTPEEIAKGYTTFAVVWGGGERPPFRAFFQPNRWETFAGIPDGLSNTGAIFQRKTSFCWMDPTADIPFEIAIKGLGKDDKGIGITDQSGGKKGTYFALFDGSVRFMPEEIEPKILKAIITCNGGESAALP